jgi:RNA polymerase-binding transcription factor DksA
MVVFLPVSHSINIQMNQDFSTDLHKDQLEQLLIKKKIQLNDEIKSIENNDPVMVFAEIAAEPLEMGTDSWQAEVHGKAVATKNNLLNFYQKVERALGKIKEGTYGRCDRCGNQIDPERLKALPAAEFCTICS